MESSNLRIVFFGTSEFAVASLDLIIKNNYNIVGVITIPDKPAGRGQKVKSSPVKDFAIIHNLKIFQPINLKNPEFIENLRSLNADLQIIIAFRILPEIVWNMPPLGTFNLHASVLPMYRGAAPINWAIINGENETGVTTFFLDKNIDTGKIIFTKKLNILPNETAGELHDRLKIMGAELVIKTLKAIENNDISVVDQSFIEGDNLNLNPAPKLQREHCRINWNNNAINVINFIRGLSPVPCAFTELKSPNGNLYYLKIYKAEIISFQNYNSGNKCNYNNIQPGKIVTDGKNYLHIISKDEIINLKLVQLQGKNKMSVIDFLRGFRVQNDWMVC